MLFLLKQFIIFAFLLYCMQELFWAISLRQPLRIEAFLWAFLPVVPFGAFVVRYGRPPEPPADGDDGFWWGLCAICGVLWALLKFVIVG